MTEIKHLENEIRVQDRFYWEDQNPQISDQDYDNLTNQLKQLDPTNPILTKIHTPVVSNGKVKHRIPMLSLNKVYSVDELIKWCHKVARNQEELFNIQVKYDGCSANYENGILATRGDGHIGEDISDKLPIINIIGDLKNTRGEILFTKENFEKYKLICKKKDGSEYSNPRNACAGVLNRDDNPFTEPILTLVPFDYGTILRSLVNIEQFNFNLYIAEVKKFDFPADGLVIKLADLDYKESLGTTSHHPKGEMALKFVNETGNTKLRGVTWSVGKEVITPIGNVEPVEISGVIVKNVSLHNIKFIEDRNILIGDSLVIERAGDVIPHVAEVIWGEERGPINITNCPECGALTEYDEPNIKCVNQYCVGKQVNKLYDAVVRIGIERIGKPTLRNMIQILSVNNLLDLFSITKDALLKLPKFGEKKAQNTLDEIDKIRDAGVYEWQILAATNIHGIGRTLSKTLCEKFGIIQLMDLCYDPDCTSILSEIEGIEEKRANDIQQGIRTNEGYIEALYDLLPLKAYAVIEDSPLPTVCFSGKFSEQKSVYYKKLEGKYDIVKSVTKDLDILVVADKSKGSSKQKKAEKNGIKIMGIEEIVYGFTTY
jgi:DNA ligase (NAD+)